MVGSHGAAGMAASRMLAATLREYALQLAAGDWKRAEEIRTMLEILQYAIPLGRAGKNDKTLIVLCAG